MSKALNRLVFFGRRRHTSVLQDDDSVGVGMGQAYFIKAIKVKIKSKWTSLLAYEHRDMATKTSGTMKNAGGLKGARIVQNANLS